MIRDERESEVCFQACLERESRRERCFKTIYSVFLKLEVSFSADAIKNQADSSFFSAYFKFAVLGLIKFRFLK